MVGHKEFKEKKEKIFHDGIKPKKKSFLDGEIDIKIRPRKILKAMVLIALFALVFQLGKLSTDTTSCPTVDCPVIAETAEVTLESAEATESFITKTVNFFSGLLTGVSATGSEIEVVVLNGSTNETTANLTGQTTAVDTEEETTEIEEEIEDTPEEEAEEEAEEEIEEEAEEEIEEEAEEEAEEETIITEYSAVTLTISDLTLDWKTTWGKVTRFKYTIKNSESGTILPSYFVMSMAAYGEDGEKTVDIPANSQTVESSSTISSSVILSSGYAYNEIVTGDLTDVAISWRMYDAEDTLIDTYTASFNLDGEE